MAQDSPKHPPEESPFYCYAVPIAPEEGAHRRALARLQELLDHTRWLIRLRWAAARALPAFLAAAHFVFAFELPYAVLFSLSAFMLLYNAAFRVLSAEKPGTLDTEHRIARARRFAAIQILTDLVTFILILHFSGGVENPFLIYFIFHMIITTILLSRRASYAVASLAVVLFSCVVLCEHLLVIGHYHVWRWAPRLHESTAFLACILFVFASTIFMAVCFTSRVVEKLRRRDAEFISLTTSLERGTIELQAAYQRMKAVEEKKSAFLRVASHQLRSPLSAIRSLLDVILHGYAGDPDKEREMLTRAHGRADIMLGMINDLLALSRLKDVGDLPSAPGEPVNVCSLMAELDALYRPKADSKGVRLELSPPPDVCTVFASADDLREALNNLLDNAINYTPPGGAVTCTARLVEGRLVVTVSDTGIGIPPEQAPHVFEEFYRAPNAKRFQAHGTGLGLAVVKRSVEKWGGAVSVESRPGEGTTFTIEFPASLGLG